MGDETKLLMCPKCGEVDGDCKHICPYCGTATVETDINFYEEFWDLYFETKGVKLERALQQLYHKYVFNSPEFNEDLFNKRQNEDDDYNKGREEDDRKRETDLNQIKCPKCDSTAVTAGQRGFNILTGFIGSGATVNRCAKCGYKWKP